MSDGTGVLDRRYRKIIGDTLWRGLHERRIGLILLWKDRLLDCWHAYGCVPAPAEDEPWWASDAPRIMAHGPDAKAAVVALLAHDKVGLYQRMRPPRATGLSAALLRASIEMGELASALSR
jgi:hypothetical protein